MATVTKKRKWFTCHACKQRKCNNDDLTTGYGIDDNGKRICFACCGERDRLSMREGKPIALYLNMPTTLYMGQNHANGSNFASLTNWPGTLKIVLHGVRKGYHNMAGYRYDVWFTFEGHKWHGVQYGDNTQICRCRTVRKF